MQPGDGPHFDILIRGGAVVDGSGGPRVAADVGINGDRIAAIGALRTASGRVTVEAAGKVVAPGFIDIHTHADIALLARPEHRPKITQGVTTEVFSNCGLGFAPVNSEGLAIQRDYLLGLFGRDDGVDWGWRSVAEFLERFRGGTGANAAYLAPHGSIRVSVLGMESRAATADEVVTMAGMMRQAMDDGAWGMSTGHWYAPMSYAAEQENEALCRATASRGGFFAVHMRDYGANILESIDECCRLSSNSGAPLQISHLQIGGAANWGRAPEVLAHIQAARARGVDVLYDAYPYTAGSTFVQAMLPTWATAGGPSAILKRLGDPGERELIVKAMNETDRDWTRHVLCGAVSARYHSFDGMTFAEICERRGGTMGELVVDVLIAEELQCCFIAHQGDPADLRAILAHPAMMVGSDGLHLPGKTHPRLYGAFPRLLARFVREDPVLTLEDAIWKMTGAPARRMGFRDRGRLSEGLAADVVVFDPESIEDRATFEEPLQVAAGIEQVLVNGRFALRDAAPTGELAGRVLTP